jgi:hypothetical protein
MSSSLWHWLQRHQHGVKRMIRDEESEFVRTFRERQEAFDRAWKRVDETGCWAPPEWESFAPFELLRSRRRFAGLSQEEAGRRAGIAQSEVSRVEAGRDASWSTYDRLAHALDCDLVIRLKPRHPDEGPAR